MDDQFRKLYFEEATGHLDDVNRYVASLQKNPSQLNVLEELYGTIHTLKSISHEMKFDRVGDLLHSLEALLQDIHQGKRTLTDPMITLLFNLITFLDGFLERMEQGREAEADPEDLMTQVLNLKTGGLDQTVHPEHVKADPSGLSLYSKHIRHVRLDVEKIDKMVTLVSELVISKIKLAARVRDYPEDKMLADGLKAIDRQIAELQTQVIGARLIPLEYVFSRFPRLVRELSRQQGKEINLSMKGGDIELDRTILDGLAEPLVHVAKNAVDHGIESPAERKKAGKQPIAQISMTARRKRNRCIVEVTDDGRGIDPAQVLQAAGAEVPEDPRDAMAQAIPWALKSGFSTASEVTEISGRGVGLPFVKQRVETLGGRLTIDSETGRGTKIKIALPLTMAIIHSLLVQESSGRYALPLPYVGGSVKISKRQVFEVEQEPVMDYRGRTIRLMALDTMLHPEKGFQWYRNAHEDTIFSVVVLKEVKSTGLVVNELLGRQEIVVKPLDRLTSRFPFFSGATILEDGQAAFILDVANLNHN